MSFRANVLHYSNFQNQKTFLVKAKWNYFIAVNVNDVRKHYHDIVLIATCFVFLDMVAKRAQVENSETSEISKKFFRDF